MLILSKQREKRDVGIGESEHSDLKLRSSGFRPEISPTACKGCNICVYICGKMGGKALGESDERTGMGGLRPEVKGRCIGCRWCERYCPDFAISIEEEAK
jgi:2-oxoglutarate ferredoxin oxidoreductase subunit delta